LIPIILGVTHNYLKLLTGGCDVKQNITLTLEKDLLRQLRVIAAQRAHIRQPDAQR
jgi:hypothetical protein